MDTVTVIRGPTGVISRMLDINGNVNFRHVIPVPCVLEMLLMPSGLSVEQWQSQSWGAANPKSCETTEWDDDLTETSMMCLRFTTNGYATLVWKSLAALFPDVEFRTCAVQGGELIRDVYAKGLRLRSEITESDERHAMAYERHVITFAPLARAADDRFWQF